MLNPTQSRQRQKRLLAVMNDVAGRDMVPLLARQASLMYDERVWLDALSADDVATGLARAEHVAVLVTDLQLDAGHRLSNRSQPLGHGGVLTG